MTVHDDLATLRGLITDHAPDGYDQVDLGWTFGLRRDGLEALSRVEAEIARLERKRDEAWFEERRGIDPAGNETVSVWCRRCGVVHQSPVHCPVRNGAAEAEVARLRDGLRLTLARIGHMPWCACDICSPARALLADQDGAARLPGENGWNYPPPADSVHPGGAA